MAEFNWTTLGSATTSLSTGLNSLADGSGVLASAIDNADGDFYAAWELYINTVDLSAQDNPAIYVYFVRSIDGGSNYEDGGSAEEPAKRPDIIFPLQEVNDAQRVVIDMVLSPQDFKPLLFNHTGAALNATGNTLKYAEYSTESN